MIHAPGRTKTHLNEGCVPQPQLLFEIRDPEKIRDTGILAAVNEACIQAQFAQCGRQNDACAPNKGVKNLIAQVQWVPALKTFYFHRSSSKRIPKSQVIADKLFEIG